MPKARLTHERRHALAKDVAAKFVNHVRTIDELNGRKIRGSEPGRPHGFTTDRYRRDLVWAVIVQQASLSEGGYLPRRDRWIEDVAREEQRWLSTAQIDEIANTARSYLIRDLWNVIDENGEVLP